MRSFGHPGPVHPQRMQCVPATAYPGEVALRAGTTLLDGIAQAASAQGASGAVLSLQAGSFDPCSYVIPAHRQVSGQTVWYSDTRQAQGEAVVQAACITYGLREGKPLLHCHAVWRDESGQIDCGHVLPDACRVRQDLRLQAWWLDGAVFSVGHDAETRCNIFQATACPPQRVAVQDGSSALALRLRPNQDICLALEDLCWRDGIRRARICGGVGSLIGAVFTDGGEIESFLTETFVRSGDIVTDADGAPRCTIDVTSVDNAGRVYHGTLARGCNPVLITFELALDILERTT